MSQEKDQLFFRNFALVVGILAVLMVIFIVLSRIYGIDEAAEAERDATAVAERTAPVGEVVMKGEEGAFDEAPMTMEESTPAADSGSGSSGDPGQHIYENLCVNCHGISALAAMIPQMGDASAWAPRISKGVDVLYEHALNGFTGELGMMPARGGNPALSDDEVKAAVDYMVSQSQ